MLTHPSLVKEHLLVRFLEGMSSTMLDLRFFVQNVLGCVVRESRLERAVARFTYGALRKPGDLSSTLWDP